MTLVKAMLKITVLSGIVFPGYVYQPRVIVPGTVIFTEREPPRREPGVTPVAVSIEGSYNSLRLNDPILLKLIAVIGTIAVVAVVTTVPTVEIGAFCDNTSCEVMARRRNGRISFFTDPVFGVGAQNVEPVRVLGIRYWVLFVGAQNVEPVRVLGIICRGSKC